MIVWRGSLLALIYPRDRVTWKVLCTAASSTPIRVVTREVRYIHELYLILEHSMLVSSPFASGLTSP